MTVCQVLLDGGDLDEIEQYDDARCSTETLQKNTNCFLLWRVLHRVSTLSVPFCYLFTTAFRADTISHSLAKTAVKICLQNQIHLHLFSNPASGHTLYHKRKKLREQQKH